MSHNTMIVIHFVALTGIILLLAYVWRTKRRNYDLKSAIDEISLMINDINLTVDRIE